MPAEDYPDNCAATMLIWGIVKHDCDCGAERTCDPCRIVQLVEWRRVEHEMTSRSTTCGRKSTTSSFMLMSSPVLAGSGLPPQGRCHCKVSGHPRSGSSTLNQADRLRCPGSRQLPRKVVQGQTWQRLPTRKGGARLSSGCKATSGSPVRYQPPIDKAKRNRFRAESQQLGKDLYVATIGRNGITETFIQGLADALAARKLVKVC